MPAFDALRYGIGLLAAPALGFTVADHLPVVTLTAKHDTPPWGAEAELTAALTNAAGAPLQGAIVKLQRLESGWQDVGLDVTGADGEAVFTVHAGERHLAAGGVRAASGAAGWSATTSSRAAGRQNVTPHAALTTPRVPAVVDAADLVTVTGTLLPYHPAGEHTVQLEFQRRGAGGDWVSRLKVAAVNRDANGGETTRYVGHARLTPGSWRVQATHPADEEHALSTSSWRTFTVE